MKELMIYKFCLQIIEYQDVSMPKGAEILTVQMQNGMPCIWVIVDPYEPKYEERMFQIIGTGNPFLNHEKITRKYIGTVQMHAGVLVYHIFEYIVKA